MARFGSSRAIGRDGRSRPMTSTRPRSFQKSSSFRASRWHGAARRVSHCSNPITGSGARSSMKPSVCIKALAFASRESTTCAAHRRLQERLKTPSHALPRYTLAGYVKASFTGAEGDQNGATIAALTLFARSILADESEHVTGNVPNLDFLGAFGNAVAPMMAIDVLELLVTGIAPPAM